MYITVKQSPIYHQMTLEEFLFQTFQGPAVINENMTNTRTYEFESASAHFTKSIDVDALVWTLAHFNQSTEELREKERISLYNTFYIPKKSGGLRKINAPNPELMNALRRLKTIFEEDFKALYHTSAFAYVKKRCTVNAVERHQQNNSKWFANSTSMIFFGSTIVGFVMEYVLYDFPVQRSGEDGKWENRAEKGTGAGVFRWRSSAGDAHLTDHHKHHDDSGGF